MRILADSISHFQKLIDMNHSAEQSIVLRYMNVFQFDETSAGDSELREWLKKTSLREGVTIFPLLIYRGIEIHILDETSFMYTKTLKSIDGCVTIGTCKVKGHNPVVFESGGNTGTALTVYGRRAGLETFFFCPEENIPLLNSKEFGGDGAHLISVEDPGAVKKAARLFADANGIKHIPETAWRYTASSLRGCFILEGILDGMEFDWITQAISAAFGPIGIYRVLARFSRETGFLPRFLGVQQEVNSPLFSYWKSNLERIEAVDIDSTNKLLSKIMYDSNPRSYGTFADMKKLLLEIKGDLTTVNHGEFADFLRHEFEGKTVLDLFKEKGVPVSQHNGEIIDKTGLMALAGTIKEIDRGKIERGSRVLCCLTSGACDADGRSEPEFHITRADHLEHAIADYSRNVFKR
jgi:threonine synthase